MSWKAFESAVALLRPMGARLIAVAGNEVLGEHSQGAPAVCCDWHHSGGRVSEKPPTQRARDGRRGHSREVLGLPETSGPSGNAEKNLEKKGNQRPQKAQDCLCQKAQHKIAWFS
jgi:hypothetical protein